MTPLFTWNDSFVTHLPSVDEQHQRLVDLINELSEFVITSEVIDAQAFSAMLDSISTYASLHFSDEESQMVEAGVDPRHLEFQRAEHRAFVHGALRLGECGDSMPAGRANSLVEYLVRWLACHILVVDQSMARQVMAIQNGKSPAEAFEHEDQSQASGTDPLLAAMTKLLHELSARNRELDELNRDLEQRVQERTIDLENANRQLQLLSTQDELTGLPNRRFANLSLEQLWLESRRYSLPLAVLMLDADHFKQVNDRFGHPMGDALLKNLATRLRDAVRRSDIVCRLGGDEFLVICPQSSLSGATTVARKILDSRRPFLTSDGVACWDGAISIGIAEATATMTSADDLLKAADEALYTAKRQGGAQMAGHDIRPE